jgi:site-specific DNA-methyltransferase (adenine-specific)
MSKIEKVLTGDCVDELRKIKDQTIDLVYMDPPFFTQKDHSLTTRDNSKQYTFNDKWSTLEEYLELIRSSLVESKRVLKNTGSIFLHCDKAASHYLRLLLDELFGSRNFRSEIIWTYKRWSNAKKGLLNSHQNIYFYSKSPDYKFNVIYMEYAPTTNIDQILQARVRNRNGKAVYMKDEQGNIVLGKEKKGVPLSDVWNIPFLNPKARERVGFPTQKPVLLLKRIIEIATDEGDLVLDPFCGSGTTCMAARCLNRNFIGIDKSGEAIELTHRRLEEMIVSDSYLLKNGEEKYIEKSKRELAILESIGAFPVQRNKGVDGFLKEYINGKPVPVKIQAEDESLQDAGEKLKKTTRSNKYDLKILIRTNEIEQNSLFINGPDEDDILIIDSYDFIIDNWKKEKIAGTTRPIAHEKLDAAVVG